MPASLLRSPDHAGLAVAAWAVYETLMPRKLGGGRAAARARRCWVGDALGVSEKTLDRARRSLLADGAGGPWLARSAPLGAKRAVRHMALRLPRDTGEAHAAVPAWTLELISPACDPGRRISPNVWRLYGLILLVHPSKADHPLETSNRHLGQLLNASADTGRRRLGDLERAGLVEVTERAGGQLLVRPVHTPKQAAVAAATYATQGRKRIIDPTQPRALTPRRSGHSPLADPGTPQETPELKSPELEAPGPPAVGDVQVDSPL
ncbi:hypothetical protein [Acrocarpospora pleiomorpha]|nr:hypothetical protein [Acrocarpospora pleiomorpha]